MRSAMIESASRSSREGWYTAFAPATIANFGSGFDAFAAALVTVVSSEGGSRSGDGPRDRSGGASRSGGVPRNGSEGGSRSGDGPRDRSSGGSSVEMRSIGDLVSVRRAKHRGVRV